MKNVFITILREVGIALLILIVLAAVVVIAFKDQLPYDEVIPAGKEYVKINQKSYKYSESTDRLSEIEAIKITHETEQNQIIAAENDVRVQTGKYTPFGTISGTSDLPTERVGVAVTISDDATNKDSSETSSSDNLQYPDTSDPIQKIEEEQSESSESAATRRFNSVED